MSGPAQAIPAGIDAGATGFRRITAGLWYPVEIQGPVISTTNCSLNEIKAMPFSVNRLTTWSTVAVECTGAVAGALYRMAIFADTGFGFPGECLQDFGTVDISAVIGEKDLAIDLELAPGLYWLAGGGQGTYTNASRPSVRCIGPGLVNNVPGGMFGTNINYACIAQQGVTDTMAGTTWPTVFNNNTSSPSQSPPGTWQCYGNAHRLSMLCAS